MLSFLPVPSPPPPLLPLATQASAVPPASRVTLLEMSAEFISMAVRLGAREEFFLVF